MTLDNLLNGDDAIDLINENKDSNNEHIDELKLENNKNKKYEAIKDSLAEAYTIIATAVYVKLGIMLKDNNGWKYFWFLFLLIPVIPSICIMIYKRKITAFCYPMAIAVPPSVFKNATISLAKELFKISFNTILLSSSINIFISSYDYIMSQKQPENNQKTTRKFY